MRLRLLQNSHYFRISVYAAKMPKSESTVSQEKDRRVVFSVSELHQQNTFLSAAKPRNDVIGRLNQLTLSFFEKFLRVYVTSVPDVPCKEVLKRLQSALKG